MKAASLRRAAADPFNAVATAIFQTQGAGPAVLILFLCVGFWLLSGVKRV